VSSRRPCVQQSTTCNSRSFVCNRSKAVQQRRATTSCSSSISSSSIRREEHLSHSVVDIRMWHMLKYSRQCNDREKGVTWEAQYNTWLLTKLTPKGAVLSFYFISEKGRSILTWKSSCKRVPSTALSLLLPPKRSSSTAWRLHLKLPLTLVPDSSRSGCRITMPATCSHLLKQQVQHNTHRGRSGNLAAQLCQHVPSQLKSENIKTRLLSCCPSLACGL